MKPVIPRDRARRDLEDAAEYYAREAGASAALRFVDAVERTFGAIAGRPASGSPRYAYELDLPGLRVRPVGRYPYLIFYIEREDHMDVWRVLHARRDIPAWMREPEDG
ncbi:MAG TPA: type II toxin-antitoxin system RelE/ParE family toxin [Rhizomicrobium sp.]|nr:type II toxin-antitoxin system RelE/ParE family toxin [Rhizomicrobium sp.]